MRNLMISLVFSMSATVASAASIDPETTELAWKNGPTRDAVYRLVEHSNKVHVFEAWRISCSWCNRNAPQVKAMAAEYADDERVQFVDLGLDTYDGAYVQWIQRHNPPFPVVRDSNVFSALRRGSGVPQTFVVDCTGELVGSTIGYWGDREKRTIREAIEIAKETVCD